MDGEEREHAAVASPRRISCAKRVILMWLINERGRSTAARPCCQGMRFDRFDAAISALKLSPKTKFSSGNSNPVRF